MNDDKQKGIDYIKDKIKYLNVRELNFIIFDIQCLLKNKKK